MRASIYHLLDIFFFFFHTVLILFNLFGWIWYRTRRLHLIVVLCIAFFWFIVGLWYGIGYCPFTDWHWQTRRALGYYDLPYSYIKFLLDSLTGLNFNAVCINYLTGISFILVFIVSVALNIRDRLREKQK